MRLRPDTQARVRVWAPRVRAADVQTLNRSSVALFVLTVTGVPPSMVAVKVPPPENWP
jgi:hypothetical protein